MKHCAVIIVLATAGLASAETSLTAPIEVTSIIERIEDPRPVIPAPSAWPGVMALIVGGLFVTAAAVGVVVEINPPGEEPPDTHPH